MQMIYKKIIRKINLNGLKNVTAVVCTDSRLFLDREGGLKMRTNNKDPTGSVR